MSEQTHLLVLKASPRVNDEASLSCSLAGARGRTGKERSSGM